MKLLVFNHTFPGDLYRCGSKIVPDEFYEAVTDPKNADIPIPEFIEDNEIYNLENVGFYNSICEFHPLGEDSEKAVVGLTKTGDIHTFVKVFGDFGCTFFDEVNEVLDYPGDLNR